MDKFETRIISNSSITKSINYLWTLDKFSLLSKNDKSSPAFPDAENVQKWNLLARLCKEDLSRVSILLQPVDAPDHCSFSTCNHLRVLNSNHAEVLSRTWIHTFTKPFLGNGYAKFARVSELQNYVENDELKIQITIDLDEYNFNSSNKIKYDSDNPIAVFANNFQSMFLSQDFCDFVIKVDNEEIPAHKVVLAARSPVFKAMLMNDVLETKEGFVTITDFGKNTISTLIKFMYTTQFDVKGVDDAKQLFQAADKYGLLDLKQLCENYLIDYCTVHNALDSLVFAAEYHAEHSKKGIIKHIVKNKDLFKNLESLNYSDSTQNLVKDLILEFINE